MKTSDILHAFHGMPACDRLDLICRLLRSCVPYELRFLGTVVLDSSRVQLSKFAQAEASTNHVNYFSSFKDTSLSHAICEKLCCALAVVHADNHPVAEAIFGLLNNQQVLALFEETADLKVLEDFRLLYVMAVNHPALSFNQRQHLLYLFLQRMDSVYADKCKSALSASLSSSIEKASDGEISKYPPQGSNREPAKDAYLTYCDVHSVYKRPADKRYAYMIQVEWTDGTTHTVRRTYGDYFSFHTKLLDLFPGEGGQRNKKDRMIPYLPGKSYPRILTNRNNRELAEKRLPELHRYAKELIALPERMSRSAHVLDFFRPRPEDMKEEYPPIKKITTLYDLLESGKARLRNYSDPPGKGSPSNSPHPIRSSPLHRATENMTGSLQLTRTAHTLPHHSSAAVSQNKEESPLERRFTYPSRRSAFTPVIQPTLPNQVPPTSGPLANSHLAIANGSPSLDSVSKTTQPSVTTPPPSLPTTTSSSSLVTTSTSSHVTATTSSSPPSTLLPQTQVTSSILTSTVATATSPLTPPPPHTVTKHTTTIDTSNNSSLVKPTPTYALSHNPHSTSTPHTTPSHLHTLTAYTAHQLSSPTHASLPTQVHTHTITPSPPPLPSITNQPALMAEQTYTFAQFVPMSVPIHHLSFSPVPPYFAGFSSPVPSPSPSPITPRVKSHSNIAWMPTEYDSLTKWLKGHRLHKYAPIFENMTFEELLTADKEFLKKKGMTEGAANKLLIKTEELRSSNFGGFRDMPYNVRMSRKPSTCSLPAALLAERAVTPSSSVDGLSPTESTCSLDKGTTGSMSQSAKSDFGGSYGHSNGPTGQDVGSVGGYDAAILKAVPTASAATSTAAAVMNGGDGGGGYVKLHLCSPTLKQQLPLLTQPLAAGGASEGGHETSVVDLEGVASGGSWADQIVPDEEGGRAGPDWAQLSTDARSSHSHTPTHPHTPSHSHHHHHHHHQLTPTHQHQHTPLAKRQSAESKGAAAPIRGGPAPPTSFPRTSGSNSSSTWSPNTHRQPTHGAARAGRMQGPHILTQAPPHSMSIITSNGLLPPPPTTAATQVGVTRTPSQHPAYAHGLYPVLLSSNQGRGPPPVTCFNCGKKGHLGNTCPGETIDTNNPDMFHKQLERLSSKQVTTASKAH